MPIGAGAVLGIQTGMNILNTAANFFDRKRQERYNEKQTAKQQAWNLAQWNRENDANKEQWQRQNQYNSPIEQMARFKKAGLNPHLIYGKGSASAGTASTITSPDVKGYNRPEAQNVQRGLDTFGDFNQFKQIQAQTDNVRQATELSKQQQLLTGINAANAAIKGDHANLNFGIAKELRETSISAAQENLTKLQHETRKSGSEANFAIKSASQRMKKLMQEVKNLKRQGRIQEINLKLKKWEDKLKDMNLTPNDHVIFRALKKAYDSYDSSKGSIWEQ